MQQGECAFEGGALLEVGGLEGFAFDEAQHHDAWGGVEDLGGEATGKGSARGGALVEAHHAVHWDVFADAYDIALAVIGDEKVGVGDAAFEGFEGHRAGPKGELGDSFFQCRHRRSLRG